MNIYLIGYCLSAAVRDERNHPDFLSCLHAALVFVSGRVPPSHGRNASVQMPCLPASYWHRASIIIASIESFGSVHCCCCAKERDASLPGSMISWCCRVPWRCGLLQLISLLAFPAAAHLKSTGIGCICVRHSPGGAVASPETLRTPGWVLPLSLTIGVVGCLRCK